MIDILDRDRLQKRKILLPGQGAAQLLGGYRLPFQQDLAEAPAGVLLLIQGILHNGFRQTEILPQDVTDALPALHCRSQTLNNFMNFPS